MKIRKCLLVDDSEVSLLALESHLEKIPLVEVIGTASNYAEAIDFLSSNDVDLLFLDIELPDLSGLSLLKTFTKLPTTILMSSHQAYASESYEIGIAIDYLVKPFVFERVLVAVNRAINSQTLPEESMDYVFLKMGRKFARFNYNDIDYIEAYGIYVKLFVNERPYIINETISSILPLLKSKKFIRTHKSYIINTDKITGFGPNEFFIDTTRIPIGVSYKPRMENFFKIVGAGSQPDNS